MFHIVEFLDTQEVEVVPALWVADEVCHWPSHYKSEELGKAIRNEEQPGHMWDVFRVRILYSAANYKTARLKLPEAEAHTDIQTAEEDEDDNPKKRKRMSTCRFESDSEDEVTVKQKKTLPPAPKIKKPNFEIKSAMKRPPLREVQGPSLQSSPTNTEPQQSVQSPPTSSGQSRLSMTNPSSQDERQSGTISSSGLSGLLQRMLTNQEMIMEQLKIIQMNLQKNVDPTHVQDPIEHGILPLKDATALLDLERRLREEVDLKTKMITTLSVIGGVDVKDSVWRLMKHCFTNSFAKQLNWRGINGKTAFHGLQMKHVITSTVRTNRLTATATDQEIESHIKRWLHLAGDRDGGRREREERRRTQNQTCLHNDTDGPNQEQL
ncbi:uncharacterized protein [Paramisgurnus dabryanus]|uniref:uncharacterized protein n=1 Tax=Paramisgurnus dabryanus TaxID=90735 RepID=UPI0031F4113D